MCWYLFTLIKIRQSVVAILKATFYKTLTKKVKKQKRINKNEQVKKQLEVLKIAIQTQDETLIAHQLAKFDLSELTNLVQTDRVGALAHIDAMLLQGDDSVFDKLIEWANEREISPSKFPRDKDALKALKELNLSNCDLKTLPQELVYLQGLEELNVSKNKFQGVVPRVICELKNLKTLILGGCGLNDLPDEFAKLQGLERLELWGNKFEKVPKALSSLKISKYFL